MPVQHDRLGVGGAAKPPTMDRPAAIAAATVLGIAGASMFIIQPGYVQGLVDEGGLGPDSAGFIAAVEMTGLALSTLFLSFASHGLNWRRTVLLSSVLATIANALCIWADGPVFLGLLRFVAGTGLGGLTCTAFAAIGETRNPDRCFGLFIAGILGYGAIGLAVMPFLFDLVGLAGFYLVLAAISGIAGFARSYLPTGPRRIDHETAGRGTVPGAAKICALSSIFVFFLGCGVLWAYLALFGIDLGLREQDVAGSLGLSQFAGVAGALLVALVVGQGSRAFWLILSLIVCGVATVALDLHDFAFLLAFAVLVSTFNFFWNIAQPLYLSAAADMDGQNGLVERMVAMQMCALALGPFAGALLVGEYGYREVVLAAALLFFASTALMIAALRGNRRELSIEVSP